MKGLFTIVLLALLISITSWIIPAWWWVMLIPFIYCLFLKASVHRAFALSFLGGFLTWTGSALFQYMRNSELIANRVAETFSLPNGLVLVVVVGLLAGVVAGIAGATGSSIHSIASPKKKKYEYY